MHPVYRTLHELYTQDRPEAAFIANVGPLVEPTSKAAFAQRKSKGGVRVPPGLFAHNVQQKVVHVVHAQETQRAKGIIGRVLKELNQQSPSGRPKFTVASYRRATRPRSWRARLTGRCQRTARCSSISARSCAPRCSTHRDNAQRSRCREIRDLVDTIKLRDALTLPLSTYLAGSRRR